MKNSSDHIGNQTCDHPNYEHLTITKLVSSFDRGQEREIRAHEVLCVCVCGGFVTYCMVECDNRHTENVLFGVMQEDVQNTRVSCQTSVILLVQSVS